MIESQRPTGRRPVEAHDVVVEGLALGMVPRRAKHLQKMLSRPEKLKPRLGEQALHELQVGQLLEVLVEVPSILYRSHSKHPKQIPKVE